VKEARASLVHLTPTAPNSVYGADPVGIIR
jgi:hypothetical protein